MHSMALFKRGNVTKWPQWCSQARVVSAATMSDGGSDYTVYTVEVTPANGGEPWRVQHRFKDFMALRSALTALVGSGNLPQCWGDVSKARSITGRHRYLSGTFSTCFPGWSADSRGTSPSGGAVDLLGGICLSYFTLDETFRLWQHVHKPASACE
jgi:hypothetical protein